MAMVFKNSMQVLLKSKRSSNLNEKMSRMLEINIEQQMEKIDKSYTFLATVGSTAPFIGLFGTVWGIMNSFQSCLSVVFAEEFVFAEALFFVCRSILFCLP
jgi:biopolymer transport protein TolQ